MGGDAADADAERLGLMDEGSRLVPRCDRVMNRSICPGGLCCWLKRAHEF